MEIVYEDVDAEDVVLLQNERHVVVVDQIFQRIDGRIADGDGQRRDDDARVAVDQHQSGQQPSGG